MADSRMSDLITEEIEAVMRERAEAQGRNHQAMGWRFQAFQEALGHRTVLAEATRRAIRRYDAGEEAGQPKPELTLVQQDLFDEDPVPRIRPQQRRLA